MKSLIAAGFSNIRISVRHIMLLPHLAPAVLVTSHMQTAAAVAADKHACPGTAMC